MHMSMDGFIHLICIKSEWYGDRMDHEMAVDMLLVCE